MHTVKLLTFATSACNLIFKRHSRCFVSHLSDGVSDPVSRRNRVKPGRDAADNNRHCVCASRVAQGGVVPAAAGITMLRDREAPRCSMFTDQHQHTHPTTPARPDLLSRWRRPGAVLQYASSIHRALGGGRILNRS